jgi:hypothetical protein
LPGITKNRILEFGKIERPSNERFGFYLERASLEEKKPLKTNVNMNYPAAE